LQASELVLDGVSIEYPATESNAVVKALRGANLRIPLSRYTLGIVGESGSGKTTLGMSIMKLIEQPGKITSGKITFEGADVLQMHEEELRKYRWKEVSMVFQSAMNSLNPVKTISDHVAEVITEHTKTPKKVAREEAVKLLESVGIESNRVDAFPHELSGGMRQRVVIAMAMALRPKLLIADEPTSALDVVVQRHILSLLKKEVQDARLSLLFITHEIAVLRGLVDNLAVLHKGEIVEVGPLEEVINNPLHPYTEMLVESFLTLDVRKDQIEKMDVKLNSGLSAPEGSCLYSDRCKYVFDKCRKVSPQLIEVGRGRWVACHKYP
jgi:peptide/nickel transport system ATP-binding protein